MVLTNLTYIEFKVSHLVQVVCKIAVVSQTRITNVEPLTKAQAKILIGRSVVI
jgi:hypothetical protein